MVAGRPSVGWPATIISDGRTSAASCEPDRVP